LRRDSAVERQALRSVAGMAYFAGTGPIAKTCGQCPFWAGKPSSDAAICLKYKRMMDGRQGPPVPREMDACKYFEERPVTASIPIADGDAPLAGPEMKRPAVTSRRPR
jgi:hypothetical protein